MFPDGCFDVRRIANRNQRYDSERNESSNAQGNMHRLHITHREEQNNQSHSQAEGNQKRARNGMEAGELNYI
jgi:hypothetical protein